MSKDTILADILSKYERPLTDDDTFSFLDDYSDAINNHSLSVVMDVLLTNYSIYNQSDYDANVKRRSDSPMDEWKYWFHKKQDTLFLMKEIVRLLCKRHMGTLYLDPYNEDEVNQILEEKYGLR